MRIIIQLVVALGLVFAAGCGKDVTKDITALADRACECKDAACGNQVVDDFVQLSKDHPNARGDEAQVTADSQRLGECVIKAGVDPEAFLKKMQEFE